MKNRLENEFNAKTDNRIVISQLPEHLVNSLKVLFEIIDVKRSGFVSFEELAQKWCKLPTENLPSNFLECLKSVTPLSGILTFERFLAGVRLSIYKRQSSMSCASHPWNQKINNYRLHRVRSEGKLQEISNNLNNENTKFKNSTKKRAIVRAQTRDSNVIPLMGVNVLNPANNNNNNRNENNYFTVANLQKKTEYRSQPDITKINQNFECFNNNFSACLDREIQEQKNSNLKPTIKTNNSVSKNSVMATNYGIVMRPKKTKSTRAPLPPTSVSTNLRNSCIALSSPSLSHQVDPSSSSSSASSATSIKCGSIIAANRVRPLSINSAISGCSSGMSDIQWRNSQMSTAHTQSNNEMQNYQLYAEELQPQVAKHKNLLAEEYSIIQKGMETTQKLLFWFQKRVDSLEKRKKMLNKGMVALDSAVHEQKLNFYRAQIIELTRRMKTLMVNSEHGFPSHQNMTQDFENEQTIRKPKSPTVTSDILNTTTNSTTPVDVVNLKTLSIHKSFINKDNLKIKHNVVPLTAAVVAPLNNTDIRYHGALTVTNNNNNNRSGGSLGSSSISSTQTNTTSSQNSSPEPTQQQQQLKQQQQIHMLKQQQQKLVEELSAKSRLIEKLHREKRAHEVQQMQFYNGIDKSNIIGSIKTTLPNATIVNAVRSHRIMPATIVPNENRKLINDTLL